MGMNHLKITMSSRNNNNMQPGDRLTQKFEGLSMKACW